MPRTFLVRRSNEGKRQSHESVDIGEHTTDVECETSEINNDVDSSSANKQSRVNAG